MKRIQSFMFSALLILSFNTFAETLPVGEITLKNPLNIPVNSLDKAKSYDITCSISNVNYTPSKIAFKFNENNMYTAGGVWFNDTQLAMNQASNPVGSSQMPPSILQFKTTKVINNNALITISMPWADDKNATLKVNSCIATPSPLA